MSYHNLFQPLQIGGCTVPNRIARTAHSTGTTGADLIAYHGERARGGVGRLHRGRYRSHRAAASSCPARPYPFRARIFAIQGAIHGAATIARRM